MKFKSRLFAAITAFIMILSIFSFSPTTALAQPNDSAINNAISWAQSLVGQSSFPLADGSGGYPSLNYCAKFVANAYGSATAGYSSAYALWNASDKHAGDWNAPQGSLVFFSPNTGNGGYGHVALCTGSGNLVEAGYSKIKTNTISAENNIASYLGWAWPSSSWPGRSGGSVMVPTLNSPSEDTQILINTSTTFSWSNINVSRYHFLITNPSGSTGDIYTSATSCNYTPNTTGIWHWKVRYESDTGTAGSWSDTHSFTVYSNSTPPTPSETYSINYYNNTTCSGSVASSESASSVNKNWGTTGAPGGCTANLFSAVFTGSINFSAGWYRFSYTVDDSIKLWLTKDSFTDCICDNNGQKSSPQSGGRYYNITSAGTYTVRVEYIKCHAGTAVVQASWTPASTPIKTVSFNPQGGSSVSSITAIVESTISEPAQPTRVGYTFGGWYKDSACTNVWNFSSDNVGDNMTLYAKWNINNYSVVFNSQGGSSEDGITTQYNSYISAPSAATQDGYVFGGWYKEASCNNVWNFSSDKVTDDIILYAKWTSTAKPDLIPTSITYDNSSLAIGNQINFDSGIQNAGNVDSNGFNIKWFVNGVQEGYGYHNGVPANSTVMDGNSAFLWTPTTAGSYTITFNVDSDSSINESNEDNNSTSVIVTVPPTDTTVTSTFSLSDLIFCNGTSSNNCIIGSDGSISNIQRSPTADICALIKNTDGTDYTATFNIQYLTEWNSVCAGYGILYRASQNVNGKVNGYSFQFDPGLGDKFVVYKNNGDYSSYFQSISFREAMGSNFDRFAKHTYAITVIGDHHIIKCDNTVIFDFYDSSFTSGSIGIRAWGYATSKFFNYKKVTESAPIIVNTVAFNSQGGSGVASLAVPKNSKITKPSNPSRTGYTFAGWYKEAACINPWNFSNDTVTGNITLYAKWNSDVITCTVAFDSQGGSGVASLAVPKNSKLTNPPNPSRTGYTFAGWYKEAACINPWDFSIDAVTGNITLYAEWNLDANTFIVTFNSQGGNDVSSAAVTKNTKATAPASPSRTGYTFAGWYKEAKCKHAWKFSKNKVTGNITLYAKWKINKYTVKFNTEGGRKVSGKKANYNTTISQPKKPKKKGYIFAGWYKEDGLVNAWNFAVDKVTGNTILFAKWNANI